MHTISMFRGGDTNFVFEVIPAEDSQFTLTRGYYAANVQSAFNYIDRISGVGRTGDQTRFLIPKSVARKLRKGIRKKTKNMMLNF